MFTCVDCHTDVKSAGHETPPQKITCASCHADEQAAYERSFHAKAAQGHNAQAATCVDCHGGPHELLPARDLKSRVHHTNIPATCGACHSQKFVMEDGGQSAQTVASYEQGVHGHAAAAGSEKAAVCTDCHETHEILDAKGAKSPIFTFKVSLTCGTCHDGISKEGRRRYMLPPLLLNAPHATHCFPGIFSTSVSRMVLLHSGTGPADRAADRLERSETRLQPSAFCSSRLMR
jgi:hypothetical protein